MTEGKDGSELLMKNNAIWKHITEERTLRAGRRQGPPGPE